MVGQAIAHYSVTEKIGEGGMGVVYRAHDLTLHRDVALKFLSIDVLDDRLAKENILKEARAISALNHPNICTIYEVGEAGGRPYLAMEYLEGQPLSREVTRGGLAVDVLVRYGIQLADALGHAHERGIVHRDLKAANVMVTSSGRLKVLDFGLSRRMEKRVSEDTTEYDHGRRSPGFITGTLPYTAPELLKGMEADARSDIWALGIILHELASGKRPFRGGTPYELSDAILRGMPPAIVPPLPFVVQSVIDKCLDKDPSQRYHSGGEVRAALEAASTAAQSDRVPVATLARVEDAPRPAVSRRSILYAAGLVVLVALTVAGLSWKGRKPPSTARVVPGAIQSVAVLPLENLSGDPAQDYFADGMTEVLITYVAKIRTLRVTSRTSIVRYKRTSKPLSQIARELNVDAVVEGSVERSGNRVRINAQLIDARNDRNLWAESYQNDLSDILALQSSVARAIAAEVQVQLTPEEGAGFSNVRPVKPEAYEAYLHGLHSLNERTPSDLQSAISSFEKAIELDPSYALAYAGLAEGYTLLTIYGEIPPPTAMPKAKSAAQRALAIDDSLAEAHAVLADVEWSYDWNASAADAEFRHALLLNPSYATAHQWYALYLSNVGSSEQAIVHINLAQKLDPFSLIIKVNVGWCYYIARRFDEAIKLLRKVEDSDPDFWAVHSSLGQTYLAKGDFGEAIKELEWALRLSPESTRNMALLADSYALAGRSAEARKLLNELIVLSRRRYVSPAYMGIVCIGLGQRGQALDWLEKAYADHSDWMTLLETEPVFDRLRSEPRFQGLLSKIRAPL